MIQQQDKDKTWSRIQEVVAKNLGLSVDDITVEKHFVHDLGGDSLDAVEIVMNIEDEFGIEIPDEHGEKLTTGQEVLNYIMAQPNAR